MISMTLNIAPVAWERVKRGKYGNAYVPDKTRRFKSDCATLARRHRPKELLDGPIRLTAKFYIITPKNRKSPHPITRPDLDNYLKALKDALTGVLWTDDSRVCQYGLGTGKYYCEPGMSPRIEVAVDNILSLDFGGPPWPGEAKRPCDSHCQREPDLRQSTKRKK